MTGQIVRMGFCSSVLARGVAAGILPILLRAAPLPRFLPRPPPCAL